MSVRIATCNKAVKADAAAFVQKCEAEYRRGIERAALAILENMSVCPVVLLSGPSGAGKTTTAKRIEEELERHGVNSHTVSMDNYFSTLNPRTAPRTPEGEIDFESPLLLDMDLLNEHFAALSAGKEIRIPYYMFSRQKRSASQFTRMQLKDNEVAIFEGIHALNDVITDKNPGAFGLYISADTSYLGRGGTFKPEWTRLVRRVVRDNNFRGADAGYTMALWGNVVRGERSNIDPFIHKARMRVNSSVGYELNLLRDHALPLLRSIEPDMAGYEEISRLVPILEQFEPMDSSLCPADSLLREFIGGGVYHY
ncbi:MAG: nucleoside kinase [Oscillospiraceae bacterium]|nr:nucleoside kinase [Oscillospiraceae bacterium]